MYAIRSYYAAQVGQHLLPRGKGGNRVDFGFGFLVPAKVDQHPGPGYPETDFLRVAVAQGTVSQEQPGFEFLFVEG